MKVRVTALQFSDGTELKVPENGVVLFVGPNNAGKSQTLKDIAGLARDVSFNGKTLVTAQFDKSRGNGDIEEWVSVNVPSIARSGATRFQVDGWGDVGLTDIVHQLIAGPILGPLTSVFMLYASGTSRLTAGDSQVNLDFTTQVPQHPVQSAYQSPELELELDQEGNLAFGLGVTVDRYAGNVISLRMGPRPVFEHNEGLPSGGYMAALKALPKLEEQGDGVRSYMGLVLHIAAGLHQILLIDEPEAFLHPPQARRLGGVLAGKAAAQQAFIGTHSTDIVQGALEADSAITIVRITRDGDVNHAAVLSDSAVKELWSDPLLRYSNVLDGLFHDAVVLCEGDADCRYYAAVMDHLPREAEAARDPQLLFTHCGGKSRMASVVDALRAAGVPVIVVADFDVLREETELRRLVTSLGADFTDHEHDVKTVATALLADSKPLRRVALRDDLNRKLDELTGDMINQKEAETLRAGIKADNGWDKAKRAGAKAVPQGAASDACRRLLERLQSIGLLVVPVGEVERFAPGVAGHGPAWVTEALRQRLHEAPGADAVDFVKAIRFAVEKTKAPGTKAT